MIDPGRALFHNWCVDAPTSETVDDILRHGHDYLSFYYLLKIRHSGTKEAIYEKRSTITVRR